MTNKYNNVWANTGDLGIAPTSAKQDAGFVRREKPIRQLLNYLFNGLQERVNSLLDNTGNIYDEAEDPDFMLASGLWYQGWGSSSDDANQLDVGSGTTIDAVRTCVVDGVPNILALDTDNNEIYRYNARTGALIDSSGDLSSTVGGTSPVAESFCCDNEFVYVVYSGASNPHVVKYVISSWAVDANWATGGAVLSGTTSFSYTPEIEVVSISKIAISCTWNEIAASNSYAIDVLNMSDGTRSTFGAGDCPITDSLYPAGPIASDGTNIYFTVYNAGGDYHVCTCTVANAAAGSGGSGYPHAVDNMWRLCACGDLVMRINDLATPSNSDTMVALCDSSNSEIATLKFGTSDGGLAVYKQFFSGCNNVVFDGSTVWAKTQVEVYSSVGTAKRPALIGIDLSVLSTYSDNAQTNPLDSTSVFKGPFFLPHASHGAGFGGMTFDGRDIWTSENNRYINRLPNITRR